MPWSETTTMFMGSVRLRASTSRASRRSVSMASTSRIVRLSSVVFGPDLWPIESTFGTYAAIHYGRPERGRSSHSSILAVFFERDSVPLKWSR